jgi:hypothetical protein
MGQVKILLQLLTVFGLIISAEELGIHLIQQEGWMLELVQDWSTVNIVEQVVLIIGLVREYSVIHK